MSGVWHAAGCTWDWVPTRLHPGGAAAWSTTAATTSPLPTRLVCPSADGTLLRHLRHHGALPEHQARWLFQQLILAVDYCHSAGVSNRDIKLDNILLDKSSRGRPDWPIVKLADWGQSFARAGAASEACSKVGTLAYMAPEVLAHRSYNPKRADIWSCGVVLYACLVSPLWACAAFCTPGPRHQAPSLQRSWSVQGRERRGHARAAHGPRQR